MKKIYLLISFLISVLLFSGCATTGQNNVMAYDRAKESFVKKDYAKAYQLLQEPAKAGNSNAQYALGYMYYYGKGVTADQDKANYWFKLAADQGQEQAQGALQRMRG